MIYEYAEVLTLYTILEALAMFSSPSNKSTLCSLLKIVTLFTLYRFTITTLDNSRQHKLLIKDPFAKLKIKIKYQNGIFQELNFLCFDLTL